MAVDIAPRMYCSLVDDFAVKNGIGGSIDKTAELNRHLVSAVLFGDRLLVNDGHVLLNPALQRAVADRRCSPFRDLVEKGFVQIVSRSRRDFGELAQTMADQKIVTAKDLMRTEQYQSVLKPALELWSKKLEGNDRSFVDWPAPDTRFVYQDLAKRAFAALLSSESKYESQFEQFGRELGWTGTTEHKDAGVHVNGSKRVLDKGVASRTGWEETAKRMTARCALSADAAKVLMDAGHEVYNYMWGSVLTTPTTPIRIQGPSPRLLGDLDLNEGTLVSQPREPVNVFGPDEDFALRSMHGKWEKLAPFSDAGHELFEMKKDFNDTLVSYFTTTLVSEKQMQNAANDYGKALSRHFGGADKMAKGLVVVFSAVGIGGMFLTGGALAIAIGLGATIGGGAAPTKLARQRLLWRVSSPDHKRWITKCSGPRPISWFPFNPTVGEEMTRGVPDFLG
jgi:hypothetical protein